MTDEWHDLLHGDRWRSTGTLWVEDGTEYTWEQVDALAATIEERITSAGPVRVVRVCSPAKLGCFAGQLAAWRTGCVAIADDGTLGPAELDLVRPELTLAVTVAPRPTVDERERAAESLPPQRIPAEVVAVNFTSGSTGSRKAVAVTRGNLVALFGCRGLDVPVTDRLTAGSFALSAYDGWWFDTWKAVAVGGRVVCLPNVNEDVFAWPELVEKYAVDRVLLPAAVVATLVEAMPECLAGIGWIFSGGEQFRATTYRQARRAGLTNRFVNLYGPTEATFATHRYDLPETLPSATIPIGRALDGCEQTLRDLDEPGTDRPELVVGGPLVCLGYLRDGTVSRRFTDPGGRPSYRTGDLVDDQDGDLVYAGRRDSQIKVNGVRVDAAALEHRVTGLAGVLDCRVVQDERLTVAFVRTADTPGDRDVQVGVESVVRQFSPAIRVHLIERFPTKTGGKVDTAALISLHREERDGPK
ncbi:AMP-binding protein [Micromonospora sp. WMMA1923]|uniref:AMP-binding protein n=1 Tax=Micromonospora sp. WMMA1923 TaxID=3404125 RepID=UPI003B922B59